MENRYVIGIWTWEFRINTNHHTILLVQSSKYKFVPQRMIYTLIFDSEVVDHRGLFIPVGYRVKFRRQGSSFEVSWGVLHALLKIDGKQEVRGKWKNYPFQPRSDSLDLPVPSLTPPVEVASIHKQVDQQPGEVKVTFDSQEEKIQAAKETVNVPHGVTVKVTRSRTVEHTIELSSKITVSGGAGLNLAEVLKLSVRTELERLKGRSLTESETIEYTVELNGSECSCYELCWHDVWSTGCVHSDEYPEAVPFRFRERSELVVAPKAV